ncbi:MAG: polysaccharide deacetylase family protein [Clostridia bacterium]|nr:polysaccharide deacetylase family protein [Clostridia bacterium]
MRVIYHCFPGGKHKALTMSYDDGRNADRKLTEIFNKYGLRGTFHVNAGLASLSGDRIPLEEYKDVYRGHEVSCHTFTHPTIARCPLPSVMNQVLADRRALENAVDYPVRGLSYPNGSYSREIIEMLPMAGICYSRTVNSTGSFAIPENFLEWNPTCHHKHNIATLGEQFLSLYKTQYLYLMYVWGHSYEFDNDNNWEIIENFSKLMGGKDDIWYATNIEIVDDMEAFKRLRFSEDQSFVENPNAKSVWIQVDKEVPIEIPGGKILRI